MRRRRLFVLALTVAAISCLLSLFLSRSLQAALPQPVGSALQAARFQSRPVESTGFDSCESNTDRAQTRTVVSNITQGQGALYQTSYTMPRNGSSNDSPAWAGTLRALRIDDASTLWDATVQLSLLKDVTTQRRYDDNAGKGRYIFTYLDLNGDGAVGRDEMMDFVPATFGAGRFGILNVPDAGSAAILVDYLRGDESHNAAYGLRNRSRDAGGRIETMRLGDMVHSVPVEVGAPAEAYDLLYDDRSYGVFRRQYAARRQMIYAGANDGMLHAFNGGFLDPASGSYDVHDGDAKTAHPLGAELWAYVPYNLLPQLYWLQSPDYGHVWYVDGSPRVFDARIFETDATHPGGWGTVLVTGMRLGGAPVRLSVAANPLGFTSFLSGARAAASVTLRSAYILMDITDPEQKPQLLAEITDDTGALGFTTSRPAVVTFGGSQWYLVFGSGPTTDGAGFAAGRNGTGGEMGDAFKALTTQSAKLYVYDLNKRSLVKNGSHHHLHDLGSRAAASFVGDPVAVDWNLDYRSDSVYFGTVGGTEAAPVGKLFKLDFNSHNGNGAESADPAQWAAPLVLLDPGNPLPAAPTVAQDGQGNHWVFAGSGRLFSEGDQLSRQVQSLFGLIDDGASANAPGPAFSRLVDVSHATMIRQTGAIEGVDGATTQDALADLIRARKGWKRTLGHGADGPAERSSGQMALLGGTLYVSTFTPGNDRCSREGSSTLYCLHYTTGAADPGASVCAAPGESPDATATTQVPDRMSTGDGLSTAPALRLQHNGRGKQEALVVTTQTSTGTLTRNTSAVAQDARNGEIDWRELLD